MRLSLHTKLLILTVSVSLVFFIFFLLFRASETEKIKFLFNEETKEKQTLLENIIEIKGNNFDNFMFDYSAWDEMCSFVKTVDKKWAYINLESYVAKYDISLLWIFDAQFNLVYYYNANNNVKDKFHFDKDEITNIFKKVSFERFHEKLSEGICEIRTAPIQPSNDYLRNAKPVGYMIGGRIISDHYINEISRVTNSSIKLEIVDTSKNINKSVNGNYGNLSSSVKLLNYKNQVIAEINSISEFKIINKTLEYFNFQLIVVIALSALISISLFIFLFVLVNNPIKTLLDSLITKNPAKLEKLALKKNEFGRLASLIIQFFIQKSNLELEILERKKIEKELSDSEFLYKTIFETSADAFLIIDNKFNILYANNRFKDIFQIDNENLKDFDIKSHFPKNEIESLSYTISDLFSRKIGPLQFKSKLGNEKIVDFQFSSNPISLKNDSLVLIRYSDITEIKKLEEESKLRLIKLEQSERLASLGMIVAGVAHEINNPISFISANIAYLEQYFNSIVPILDNYSKTITDFKIGSLGYPDFKKDLIDLFIDLNEGSKRINNIINELKNLARNNKDTTDEIFNINDLLKITLKFLSHEAKLKNVKFDFNATDELIVKTDKQKLGQIILNIITNALEAVDRNTGKININLQNYSPDKLLLQIQDNGRGIPEEQLSRIFDPFYSTKNFKGGLGIGLTLAKSLADTIDIEINVESTINQGTIFNLLIPKKL